MNEGKGKKPPALPSETEEGAALPAKIDSRLPASTRTIRRISPLGFRVVVKIRPSESMTDAGLYLPEGAKTSAQESLVAEVVEVASAEGPSMDEETNISGIPLHALVLISKGAGVKVPWDENLRIVDTKDVLGIVHEMRLI